MYEKKVLDLPEAEVAIQAIIKEAAKESNRPISIAVVDDRGDLVSFARMTGAIEFYGYMALRKAYSSARLRRHTSVIGEEVVKKWGFDVRNYGDLTHVPGGIAITEPGGKVVYGAIGIAGRLPSEDEVLALIGLKDLQDFLWSSK